MTAVKKLGPDDLLLCLFSGGGSSLLSCPMTGVSMLDLQNLTQQLLRSGATIQEINTIRKHLSAIQGGRLAAMSQAPILALIISDVVGDEPTHIASGPCAPDPTTFSDAVEVLERYRINCSTTINKTLLEGSQNKIEETPKPNSSVFINVENRIIANTHYSLTAAESFFQDHGIGTLILSDTVTGESSEVAKVFAALASIRRQLTCPV
ncbi:MAG: DUF4147 domain-containing protein [Nitrosomonas sp.]|nr:DUF4147 domain-containing protein [Nitrosomonas sp.]MDP1949936.1 DUF4147 domain-containing protein [Nitrosomonas sp.]